VAVVGHDARLLTMCKQMFGASGEFRSCGLFAGGAAAIRAIPHSEARLALVEMVLPDLCGIRCVRELALRKPDLRVVLATSLREPALLLRALAAGVSDCLITPVHPGQCLATLRLAIWRPTLSGEFNRSGRFILPTNSGHKGPGASLTEREQRIMACLAEGLFYKEIAPRLDVSYAVLRKLQHRLFLKLRVHKGTEAVARWRSMYGP
jgi:DNA-binding NarL/FixJ family response regulator